jgi:hypothetical protein
MAKISAVELRIVPNVPEVGKAQVGIVYTIVHSGDDVEAERGYHEVAQLFSMGIAIPKGTMSDSLLRFTANEPEFRRSWERIDLTLADLRANVAPLQDASIMARVTLTPLPSRDSNTVEIPGGSIGPP